MEILELSWGRLAIGFLSMLIPAAIFAWYRTDLNRQLAIALVRMTLQLLFVGYYLEVLFEYDNNWFNLAWILVMVSVSDFATIDRSELRPRWSLVLPVFFATFVGILLINVFFLKVVIQLPNLLQAQYAIPITGMVLGNCLSSNVIGVHDFFYRLHREQTTYQYYLSTGATRNEALFPFYQSAIKRSINPTLAGMATIGLVSLPGMMTGQVLSGTSPMIAIQYQIMIMLAIFSGTVLTVFLALHLTNRWVFHDTDMLDPEILKESGDTH